MFLFLCTFFLIASIKSSLVKIGLLLSEPFLLIISSLSPLPLITNAMNGPVTVISIKKVQTNTPSSICTTVIGEQRIAGFQWLQIQWCPIRSQMNVLQNKESPLLVKSIQNYLRLHCDVCELQEQLTSSNTR